MFEVHAAIQSSLEASFLGACLTGATGPGACGGLTAVVTVTSLLVFAAAVMVKGAGAVVFVGV